MEQPRAHHYDLAFASLPEPTLLVDERARLTLVNAAGEFLLGEQVSRGALLGEPVSRVLPWLGQTVTKVLAGADEAALESKVATSVGPRRISARLRRLRERGGAPRGLVAVLEDVTERRALEERQRSAERIAALETLAAGFAHEVNNPLACVVAGLSFLETEHARIASSLAPAELMEAKLALEEARDAALRVRRIVRSLQSFGCPATPLLRTVELAQTLREAMRLAEPELRGRAQVVAELPEGVRVRGSESLLIELFLALLVHAAQGAGAPGANAIQVTLVAGHDEAQVVVASTGSGSVASGPEPRTPFTARPQGGLGLSVSYGIVTALGGTIVLDSSPGGGTTAIVRLPIERAGR